MSPLREQMLKTLMGYIDAFNTNTLKSVSNLRDF